MVSKREKLNFLILRTVGNFLVLLSLYEMISTFGPVFYQEISFRIREHEGITYAIADESTPKNASVVEQPKSLFASIGQGAKTEYLRPVDSDFGIVIPKIGANARIIQNVDPSDYDAYMRALKEGVAHAAGTALPGQMGENKNVYLFAHSTDYPWNVGRYNAIFYLLKELDKGDEIDVFYHGQRFIYIVTDKKTVSDKDVDFLIKPTAEEQLTLQTCWPPGTTLERLLIFAKPKYVTPTPSPDVSPTSMGGYMQ